MNISFKHSALVGCCGALILFAAEWFLGAAYSEIHLRTFLFFGVLYSLLGAFLGGAFAVLFRWMGDGLRRRWKRSNHPGFLPAIFVAGYFLLYGLYYINVDFTPTVGMFDPASLCADLLCLGFAVLLFRAAFSFGKTQENVVLSFPRTALLPLSLLVAVNMRFFALQPRVTQLNELFLGAVCLGAAATLGIFLARALRDKLSFRKKAGLVLLTNLLLTAVILYAFSLAGSPSSASFYLETRGTRLDTDVPRPRNVVWIVMDTARRDHVSVYGGERDAMPHLKEFSQEALVFDRAISTAPWTFPSHASMFTGMYTSRHGAHHWNGERIAKPLSPENLTIAEILASRGYQTAGIVANHAALSRIKGCAQGFQYYFDAPPFVFSLFWGKLLQYFSEDGFRFERLWVNQVSLASDINHTVFQWLKRRAPDQPFFLFINYMEAHNGIAFLPEPFDALYGFNREARDALFSKNNVDDIMRFRDIVTPEQHAFWSAAVQRRLTFLDAQLVALFANLKAMNLYDDAMIIVNSDHGELFGEHNSFGHQTDLYNELIHIPMMVKYPRSEKAGRSGRMVQTVDIMPEILSSIGVEIPDRVQGQPFASANHQIVAELFEQRHNSKARRNPERYYRDLKTIFSSLNGDSLKYIWSSNGKSELFDLKADPEELNDIIASRQAQADTMLARLQLWENSFSPIRPDSPNAARAGEAIPY